MAEMENSLRSSRALLWPAFFVLILSPLFRFSWDLAPQVFFHLLIVGTLCIFVARHRVYPRTIPEIPIVLFLAVSAISYFFASNRSIARNELFVLSDALIFLSLFSFLCSEEKKRLLLIPPVIGLGLTAAMFVYFIYSPVNGAFGQFIPAGIVVNVNAAAGFLVLSFILSLIPVSDTALKKGAAALPVILFAGLLMTRSRAAIVAASAGAAFFAWPYLSSRLKRLSGIAAVTGLLIIISITLLKHSPSLSSRIVWWQTAMRMAIEHPLTGVGWGNFSVAFLAYRPQPALNTLYAHNVCFQIAAESGFSGLIAFLLLIVSFVRIRSTATIKTPMVRGAAIAGASFLVFCLLDYSFYLPAHLFVLAACAGTLYERHAEPRASSLIKLACGCVFLLWALIVIPPFAASRWYARGIHFHNEGSVASASNAYEKAILFDPLSPDPFSKYAELLFGLYSKTHDPSLLSRSLSLQLKAVLASPVTASQWSDLAWLYKASGENENAARAMRQAVRFDPYNPVYKNNFLRIYPAAEHAP